LENNLLENRLYLSFFFHLNDCSTIKLTVITKGIKDIDPNVKLKNFSDREKMLWHSEFALL
jgi:hypothetical protein